MITPTELEGWERNDTPSGVWFEPGHVFALENNQWSAHDEGLAYAQAMFREQGTQRAAWQWDTSGLRRSDVPLGYPAGVIGKKPWAKESNDNRFPRLVTDSFDLKVDYAIRATGTGTFNVAFDVWLCNSKDCTPESRAAELMVWISSQGDCRPAGSQYDVAPGSGFLLNVGNRDSAAWPQPFDYFAWTASGGRAFDSPLALGALLRDLCGRGYVLSNLWVASVELGTELWPGSGVAFLDRFGVIP